MKPTPRPAPQRQQQDRQRKVATKRDLDALREAFALALARFVADKVGPLHRRIEQLEQRPSVAYRGVYVDNTEYVEGNLTTHAGGLWLALNTTKSRPGTSDHWKLVVKKGEADKR